MWSLSQLCRLCYVGVTTALLPWVDATPILGPVPEPDDPLAVTLAYHEETKHHDRRYARSLGYLDWASQPDPFRRYEGCALTRLPRGVPQPPVAFDRLYDAAGIAPRPLTLDALADFLRQALAVSAWKRFQAARWALRVNPSSGNLHPTEGYLVLPEVPELGARGVFHYRPDVHALERRASIDASAWQEALGRVAPGCFMVGLTSIVWREAWKYGERAFRYCQHDVGHALAAWSLSASLQGWRLVMQASWSRAAIATLLGLDRSAEFVAQEHEEPELVALVGPAAFARAADAVPPFTAEAGATWRRAAFTGRAERLSRDHHPWPILDGVAEATAMPVDVTPDSFARDTATLGDLAAACDARAIVQQRRSAVSMDGVGTLPLPAFGRMLHRTLPAAHAPWTALPWRPHVDLFLFVHRVDDLAPGLYCLERCGRGVEALAARTREEFAWERPAGVDPSLPLYLLAEGDHRALSKHVSCHQDIAADGFFSLGMVAHFEPALRARGAWFYRNLFWETGVIGQVLYLEAEAAGARSTGIGCFFDDAVHHVLGVADRDLQCLYHFTVGMPVEDTRLTTEPGYPDD